MLQLALLQDLRSGGGTVTNCELAASPARRGPRSGDLVQLLLVLALVLALVLLVVLPLAQHVGPHAMDRR